MLRREFLGLLALGCGDEMATYPSSPNKYPASPNKYPSAPKAYPGTSSPAYPAGGVNFAALGAAFWIDASNPASYTASGTTLTSIKSLVSGTALSTIVGTPQIITDPRDGAAAFNFPNNPSDYVMGADATYLAAVNGTDKAFTSIVVVQPGDVTFAGTVDSVQDSANIGNGQYFLTTSSNWYIERDGAPSGPAKVATSEFVQGGCYVLVQHSADGLTVKTSINGGTESTASAFTTAGAISANRVGVGIHAASTPNTPFYGMIKERVYFGTDRTAAEIAAWVAALMNKWRATRAPGVYFLGDSITSAVAAGVTNGGMPGLLTLRMRALGAYMDPMGPFGTGGGMYPYRHSGVSGNTCAQMSTRVLSATQGLGFGGASKGSYRRAKLVCLFAGTNDFSTANYTTLLNNTYAQMIQAQPTGRIAVTTITDISSSTASVTAFNTSLTTATTGVWDTFEAAHPGVLIRWDAFNAAPWNAGDYVDTTHPNDAGYVKLMDNATYGLLQAVRAYLLSIQ